MDDGAQSFVACGLVRLRGWCGVRSAQTVYECGREVEHCRSRLCHIRHGGLLPRQPAQLGELGGHQIHLLADLAVPLAARLELRLHMGRGRGFGLCENGETFRGRCKEAWGGVPRATRCAHPGASGDAGTRPPCPDARPRTRACAAGAPPRAFAQERNLARLVLGARAISRGGKEKGGGFALFRVSV